MHTQDLDPSQQNTAITSTDIFRQALSLHQQGQLEQAERLYEQLLKEQPQHIDALHFLGVLKNQKGQSQQAVELISRSLEIAPNNSAAHSNLGLALQELKRFDEAIASYDRSLVLKPNNAEAYFNRGNALLALKRFDEAILDYDRALAIKPDYAEAFSNRGNVLSAVKRYDQALANYESALAIKPDYAEALAGIGTVLNSLKRYTEALVSYERALTIKPDLEFIRSTWLHTKMNICAWHEFEHDIDELTKAIERNEKVSIPFTIQAVSSSAALQKRVAEIYSAAKHPSRFLLPPLIKHQHSKIKIGYFSSDFCNHPVALLTAELFERHDRSRFEIIAFSFHLATDKDDMRLRLEAAFDQFIDVSEQSDEQVVRLARQLEIDIAVDLNGCTEGCRTDIFAQRAAPIQVNYIGYLGTMGADYIDYLLADRVLIPTEHQAYYSEKIAYLPHSFQVNDSTLKISNTVITRAEFGLPERGVVFCCFNNHYKITPMVFASWMRILHRVEGSVLWLIGGNADTEKNLRLSAVSQGIAAERLVFAQRVTMPEHLARHRLADLFLDTSPYNAGATASAALWTGLPLITVLGSTYSSRMAASLLNAIGLPELVTQSAIDYEALAIQLATHPEQLAAVKQKLADNRLTTPLFDTKLFTQHIESAFQAMFDRYQAGLAPDHIYVPADSVETNSKPVQQSELTSDSSDKFQRAVNYHQQGLLAEAERLYKEVLQSQPQHADSLHLLGVIAKQRGQAQRAVDLIKQALDIDPNNAAAYSNIGLAYQELNHFELALASYDRALSLEPHYADAYFNRGNLLLAHKEFDQALSSYDQVLIIKPDHIGALFSRGIALKNLNRHEQALASYDRALNIKPDYIEALINKANVLQELKRYDEALASCKRALAIKPEYAEALFACAVILQDMKRFKEAITFYERAFIIKSDMAFMFGDYLHIKMNICDWTEFDAHLNKLANAIEAGEKVAKPFTLHSFYLSPELLKKAAETYAKQKYPSNFLLPPLVKNTHSKIKLAYFSSDFRNHPVAYLIAELLELHDRTRFEIIAFSFSPASNKDAMRVRLEAAFDQFIDVSQLMDKQIVQLARQIGCDIAVDLNGFTANSRTGIFAMRAAPIQVSYLGFLGTMGEDYIDYLLADSTLIPTEHQRYYSEKIIYLPNSFQVNDSTLSISNKAITRAKFGLPEQGFVFCCFNSHFKITPAVFKSWMRILHHVEGSVLWLFGGNIDAETNLRLASTAQGISADRLIFANPLPKAEHLARYRLADLFLDTLPCNAGATASDALWVGLPILTCLGETFPGRMAASLLNAIGLPELITNNAEDYKALAIQLATHPEQLAALKQKLAANRLTYPLFDTRLFTQHIESAYQAMFDRYQAGLAPDYIYVSAQEDDTRLLSTESSMAQSGIELFSQAITLHQQGQLDQAELLYKQLLSIEPQHIDSLHFFGVLCNQRGQTERAVMLIVQSLELAPDNAAAHSNLGLALHKLKRYEQAIASYDRALALKPNNPEAYNNRGNALRDSKQFNAAIVSYDNALKLKPDYIEAMSSRGMVLRDIKRFNEALANYQQILIIKPDSAEAELACAVILQDLKRFNEAIEHYGRALAIKPDLAFVFGSYLYLKRMICDWRGIDDELAQLIKKIERGEPAAIPFSILAITSSPDIQKKAAYCYTQTQYPNNFLLPPLVKHTHSKIKIGYFSADFRHHAVSYLIAELIERHDRSRFEIIAFSFHATSHKDDMRLRLEAAFDQFIDVSEQSDEQVVRLARQLEIDIAVDLNGYTEDCRTNIFAMRAAPVQASYIGYLGTMGADYIDYLVADEVLIPTEHQIHYSEFCVYLPNSFQVNDRTLSISNKAITRTEFGLPEQGFVFCCFNSHFKITPDVFKSWMRILHHVGGSVLWLFGGNIDAETNLRLASTAQGISADRLIFANPLPKAEHLARYRLADLFLDTLPCNAGATASDALWVGLPILTCLGETFPGRMAASLLNAIGLPELITNNAEDYEALAIQLATHPKQLAALKQKLAANRLTYPLFDTPLFTQHLESAYQAMFDRYQAGLAPDYIYVSASGNVTQKSIKPSKSSGLLAKICQKPAQFLAAISSFGKRKKTPSSKQPTLNLTADEINTLTQAQQMLEKGQLAVAELLYQRLLKTQPEHEEALRYLANIEKQRQVRSSIEPDKQTQQIHFNHAHAPLDKKHDLNPPIKSSNTVAIKTDVEDLINQGNEQEDLGQFEEALARYDQALAINPDSARARSNRGNVLQLLKRFDEALESYDRALAVKPAYPEAFYNRGNALQACKRFQEAIISYNKALNIRPNFVDALIGLGNALSDCKQFSEALISYERALALQPESAEIIYSLGKTLHKLTRFEQALASYQRALTIKPDYVDALIAQGAVLQDLKRFNDALNSYERVLQLKPDSEFMFCIWLSLKMKLCDWEGFDSSIEKLRQKITSGEKAFTPFFVHSIATSPALQQKAAAIYAQTEYPNSFLLPAPAKHAHSKIKLAYFSADFRNHPIAHLMVELFERHDRTRFEVIAFSLHETSYKDDNRLTLEKVFDQFFDVSQQSDEQIVQLARQLETDIAINLNGFTEGCRTKLFAMRVAPIQVSYLGYLGTMGVDYMDYLLADLTLIPTAHQAYYNEKIAYLPHSFQVNASNQLIANREFSRIELGLPEQGFVFCCFNNNYKITPVIFDSWMRILHQVKGSVLWLLQDNDCITRNLQREAVARGIEAERICFTTRLPKAEHLARHRLADLFLDTSPYNAGATASDSLWAGLPVLTYLGETFAGRMGASLLYAIGLPELVTKTPAEYEALAIQLATHPEQLAAIKQKLADKRLSYPLFDTALFTQHIESAFKQMNERHQAGLAPEHIYVSTDEQIVPPVIELKPLPAINDTFQQAMNLHQQGQLAEAEQLYEQLLQSEPQHIDVLHFLGVLKNQQGQAQQAVDLIQQSLSLNANNIAAYSNLGMVLQGMNRLEEALTSYNKALELSPDNIDILLIQAKLYQLLNRPDEALLSYNRVLDIKPDFIDALAERGIVLQALNRFEDALINYDRLLCIDTDHAEAFFGRANVLYNLKRFDDALDSYNHSLAINPDSFEVLYNRGIVLADLNRIDEAIASYQKTLAINPNYAEVYNNLGDLLKNQYHYQEAETNYRRAIAIKANYVEAHCNLITLLKDQGQLLQAEDSLKSALAILPDSLDLRILKLIMTLPMITKTVAESESVSGRFDQGVTELSRWLSALSANQQRFADAELLPLPFLLAYRVGNHVQRLSRYGDLVASHDKLLFEQTSTKKIRIVIASHHFRRHSVWDVVTRGLLVHLDRSRFELILYHLGNIEDQETTFAKSLANEWRDTKTVIGVTGWLNVLKIDAPDVIFYPEIGMDPLSGRLAAHRLASLQMASWGHPITTGLPSIDLYFSGVLLESPEADSHYREKLIRLPDTGCCTTPINITPEPLADELLAQLTARTAVRFIIAQTIYKFDPVDDALYANIASKVKDSLFILLCDSEGSWVMDQIFARLEQTFVDRGLNPKQHLLRIPWQSMEKFQSLLDLCDVYLDCPSFSGYTTAWQAVHRGIPIVTLEGEFMRQRLAAGLLRKIGITDTIAHSREQYIQLAVKLANECRNPISRTARRHALKKAAPKADNDVTVIRAFEQAVLDALAERKN